MKVFPILLITLLCGCVQFDAAAADGVGADPLETSPSRKIAKEFSALLAEENYPAIYSRLHRSYSRFLTGEKFVLTVKSAGVHTVLVAPITSSISDRSGYIVVRVVSENDDGPIERTAVMFVMKEGDRWMLLNYPFAPGFLPEFYQEPCFVCRPTEAN